MNSGKRKKSSSDLYHELFTSMVDGFVLHEIINDGSGSPVEYRFMDVNPAFVTITGLAREDVIGRTIKEVFPKNWAFLMEQFLQVASSGEPYIFERHNSDTGKYLKISAFCPAQGLLACVVMDISERIRMQEALKESEETFRTHIENSFDVIFTLDAEGTFLFVSPSWERHFGYPASEVIGKNFGPYVHPEDVQPCFDYLMRVMSTGQSGTSPRYRVKRIDGNWHSFIANGSRYIDAKGEPLFIGVGHDITEQLQAEEERIVFERKILQSQKLESLGLLAGGIAHDFNNLLQAIQGNLELASVDLSPDCAPSHHVEQAIISVRHATELTNRMLAYSGKGHFNIKKLHLNELVNENAAMLRSAVSKSISLDLHTSTQLPPIKGDVAQLQQVVMNLITNAAEAIAMQPGVITLTTGEQYGDRACLSKSRLEEKPEPGSFVYLEVSDNGCGMDEETKSRLFDPFFTTKFTGRGLGMSAVLGIIKGHGGALFIESTPGNGSIFRVLFPALESVEAGAEAGSEKFIPGKRSPDKAILTGLALVVDDERAVLKVSVKMVKLCGLDVITAGNGAEAISLFCDYQDKIDIVLMDLTMPEMDGVKSMQALRIIRPDVKIILSSGFNEQELYEHAIKQAPSGFIRKPYSLKELESELRRVMHGCVEHV